MRTHRCKTSTYLILLLTLSTGSQTLPVAHARHDYIYWRLVLENDTLTGVDSALVNDTGLHTECSSSPGALQVVDGTSLYLAILCRFASGIRMEPMEASP